MKTITDIEALRHLQTNGAVFILFGGSSCNVCKNLRPRLDSMLKQDFPKLQGAYVDCELSAEICAQYGVFSLPVVKAYLGGQLIAEELGSFSIQHLRETLQRPYSLWERTNDG